MQHGGVAGAEQLHLGGLQLDQLRQRLVEFGQQPRVEIDGGLETLTLKTPCIVTTDLRLNTPRYAALPNIMKAKSKPLATITPADLGVDIAPRTVTLKVVEPKKRSGGIKVKDVAELMDKLRNEAKVI